MNTAPRYIAVKENIPRSVRDHAILNLTTSSVTASTHGFHKYPAKFIPHIPRWAIQKYLTDTKPQLVVDPFAGSGTTLVEALLARHNAIGIDIDPLSCLISKVKTTPVDSSTLNEITLWLIQSLTKRKHGRFVPDCQTLEHWFTQDAINKLSLIRTLLDEIPIRFGNARRVQDVQDLLYVCFSSIIRRVSNADNESQKTYVSHTNAKIPEETFGLFLTQLDLFMKRIIEFSKSIDPRVRCQIFHTSSNDNLARQLAKAHPDLVVTSPPYIKAIDYIYNQMVELFWIGDLFGMQTQELQNTKKIRYIGTKHLAKKFYGAYSPFTSPVGLRALDKKLEQIYSTDLKNGHKHAYVTYRYFSEMEKHFFEMAQCLRPQTHYILVVGDSSVSNVHFETGDLLANLARRNGFNLVSKWGYKIKNRYMRFDRKGRGGTIEIDWVLDLVRV
jgi:DNA modification methylase